MTEDGFTFLVMGFTGSTAARFKEAYIAALNAMERELREPKPIEVEGRPSTVEALRLVGETRKAFGTKVAQQMWMIVGLPVVLAMPQLVLKLTATMTPSAPANQSHRLAA